MIVSHYYYIYFFCIYLLSFQERRKKINTLHKIINPLCEEANFSCALLLCFVRSSAINIVYPRSFFAGQPLYIYVRLHYILFADLYFIFRLYNSPIATLLTSS